MNKDKILIPVTIMIFAGIIGTYIGGTLNNMLGGAILLSMISGIACIIYAIYDTRK